MSELSAPSHRTSLGKALAENQQADALVLQQCDHCNTVQYPPREVCKQCLSDELTWRPVDNQGVLLASNSLHNSLEPYYQAQIPWQLASVKLDAGPVVLVQDRGNHKAGANVRVIGEKDSQGNLLLVVDV